MNNEYFIKRYALRKRCVFGCTFSKKVFEISFQQNAYHITVAVWKYSFVNRRMRGFYEAILNGYSYGLILTCLHNSDYVRMRGYSA